MDDSTDEGTDGHDPLSGLRRAAAAFRATLGEVGPEQWDDPTPCAEWGIGQLVDHVVGGNLQFGVAVGGGQPEPATVGTPRLVAYDDSVEQLLEAFGADGALERAVTVGFGTVPGAVAVQLRLVELLVHGWDLARATGRPLDVPDHLVAGSLAFSRQAMDRLPADRLVFGEPQPVADDAGPLDQLVALLGRTP